MTRLSFVDRLSGTLRLDVRVVQELKMSPSANVQALFVLIVASAMAGVGFTGYHNLSWDRVWLPIGIAAVAWIVWAIVVWFLGTRVWPNPNTNATLVQELRPLAFATAPAAIVLLIPWGVGVGLTVLATAPTAIIPVIPWGVGAGLTAFFGGWGLLTILVATRHPLGYPNTPKAFGVVVAASLLLGGAVAAGVWAFARWVPQI